MFSKLYEICLKNFLENFKKIHFRIFIHDHLKLKLKNLSVMVPYKCGRSNIQNIQCMPVTSQLKLPLTNEPTLSSNHLGQRWPITAATQQSMSALAMLPHPWVCRQQPSNGRRSRSKLVNIHQFQMAANKTIAMDPNGRTQSHQPH